MRKVRDTLCVAAGLLWGPRTAALCLRSAVRRRPGQTTVEYLMMLAVVAAMATVLVILFHKKILGGVFTLAGMIIGAGTPKN